MKLYPLLSKYTPPFFDDHSDFAASATATIYTKASHHPARLTHAHQVTSARNRIQCRQIDTLERAKWCMRSTSIFPKGGGFTRDDDDDDDDGDGEGARCNHTHTDTYRYTRVYL